MEHYLPYERGGEEDCVSHLFPLFCAESIELDQSGESVISWLEDVAEGSENICIACGNQKPEDQHNIYHVNVGTFTFNTIDSNINIVLCAISC